LNEQIGACGIYCGFCPVFRLEQNRCFGCEWLDRQLKKSGKQKGCVFLGMHSKQEREMLFSMQRISMQNTLQPKEGSLH